MTIPVPESTSRRVGARTATVPDSPRARGDQGARTARSREAILTAALALYAAEGYGAVTMRGIANRLGFSAPAIYNYFLSKEEIFSTLQDIGLDLMEEAVLTQETADPLADFRAIFTNYYAFCKANPEYFSLLFVDPAAPHVTQEVPALRRMGEETDRRFSRCLESGVFADHAPVRVPGLFWAMVHGLAVLRRVGAMEPEVDFDPQVTVGLDLLLAGLKAGVVPAHAYRSPDPAEPGLLYSSKPR
ncbi:MAG: TetR/AcrR family transcriptional regulator [Vicinamibacterales bacterium]|nr:TetR/AcrR family transcriptional regulator [Vicinamibacterales bacterium]